MINLNQKSVLLLGIGGVSMHQLALCYLNLGYTVYGYDAKTSTYTDIVTKAGALFSTHFNKDFLHVNFCVKTGAIKDNNKYVVALKNLGVKILDRAEALNELFKNFKCVMAVAGTHGKSTTASLIYEILRVAGKRVSCHIGADVFAPRFNFGDDYLVVEACEYNKSFLSLYPNISIITNVEAEHMDSYKTMFSLRSAFKTFLNRGKQRFVFKCESTNFLNKIKNITFVDSCNLILKPKLIGDYNKHNISLAVSVCQSLGVSDAVITKVVNSFAGIPRRYELIGTIQKQKIYIDYAHHPTEINSFVTAFKNQYKNSLIVFQPHTYSRTKLLLNQFLEVLKDIDNLIIFKEYPAREKPSQGMSANEFYKQLKLINLKVKYCASAKGVLKNLANFDAVAFVGAGDINQIAKKIVKTIEKKC